MQTERHLWAHGEDQQTCAMRQAEHVTLPLDRHAYSMSLKYGVDLLSIGAQAYARQSWPLDLSETQDLNQRGESLT